jgi:hypothetical protein
MKKSFFFAAGFILLALLMAAAVTPVVARAFPDLIPLPDGFQPEGIVIGNGHTAYTGSLADGDIYTVDLRSGNGHILIEGPGTPAVGLGFDARSGYLYVAGGPNGDGRVYDTATGTAVATYDFDGGFVNDVVVTQDAAYFTDSFMPFLYKVEVGAAGAPAASFTALPLGGDFVFVPGGFNTNGIAATPNGDKLIDIHSSRGELDGDDPETGTSTRIDLGGENVNNGDGLVLIGHTLYVVQNRDNKITEFQLSGDYSAAMLRQTITDADFDVPTTADNHGAWLYAVNARFGTPPGPDVAYDIVKVKR